MRFEKTNESAARVGHSDEVAKAARRAPGGLSLPVSFPIKVTSAPSFDEHDSSCQIVQVMHHCGSYESYKSPDCLRTRGPTCPIAYMVDSLTELGSCSIELTPRSAPPSFELPYHGQRCL